MKTAIIKTDFWKDDKIYNLSIDARLLYLCILTNPERNGTPAFKVSDRFLVSQTGFNSNQIEVARKVLIENELIQFVDGYYIINNQDYVEPKKGKLSAVLYDKDVASLPEKIQQLLMSGSRATQECISIGISNSISISKEEEKNKEEKKGGEESSPVKKKVSQENNEVALVLDLFKEIDPTYARYFKNTTERNACKELFKAYSLEEIKKRVDSLPVYNKLPYMSSYDKIYKPSALLRNWVAMTDKVATLQNKQIENKNKYKVI